jgi:hypothetical protein
MKSKHAQEFLGMSFSVIFSIFLIIFFIVVAFIAIKAFLSSQQCAKIGIFTKDLQYEIDKAWNSQVSDYEFKRSLPSNLQYVCFANLSKPMQNTGIESDIGEEIRIYEESGDNMFLYPLEKACELPNNKVKHLNIEEMTKTKNPYCIKTSRGQIVLKIEKGFSDILVSVG